MAGGQERILRGRIRTMQATKKITRAMELIAASRIVKAQQRVQAAVPYSEQITEVVKDLAAGGASSGSPLLAGRPEIATTCYVVMTADRGLCGGYNAGVQRAAEGEIKADVLAGKGYEIVPVGRKAEAYFRFRGYQLGQGFAGFSDNPTYEDAKAIGRHVMELFASGHVDKVELVYTRFITPGSQEVVLRPLVPLHSRRVAGGDGKPAGGGRGRLRVRARPVDHPRHAAAALRRSSRLRRAAQRCGVRARVPSAGDEVGDRQRRRTDQEPLDHHEPGPPGLDHHRDHGDRRRCRGTRLGQGQARSRRRSRRPSGFGDADLGPASASPSPTGPQDFASSAVASGTTATIEIDRAVRAGEPRPAARAAACPPASRSRATPIRCSTTRRTARSTSRTVAEVWFATEEAAEAAGFAKPPSQRD